MEKWKEVLSLLIKNNSWWQIKWGWRQWGEIEMNLEWKVHKSMMFLSEFKKTQEGKPIKWQPKIPDSRKKSQRTRTDRATSETIDRQGSAAAPFLWWIANRNEIHHAKISMQISNKDMSTIFILSVEGVPRIYSPKY